MRRILIILVVCAVVAWAAWELVGLPGQVTATIGGLTIETATPVVLIG